MKVNPRIDLSRYFLFIISISIFFYSCEKEKKNVLVTDFPKDKQVLSSEYIIKNNDTILHGKFILRDYDGKKIKSGMYENGKRTGKVVYYFSNGNIESIENQDTKKLSNEIIYNFENGKIRKYSLYDDLGRIAFILRFDEQGNVKSFEGLPLMEIYQYKIANKEKFNIDKNQVLKLGDTLNYKYLLANIPHAKRTFKIETVALDNSKIKRRMQNIPPARIDVQEVLTKKGEYQVNAIVQYKFEDKDSTVINDTISFSVRVN